MTAGDPQASYMQWPYPYPTHYFAPTPMHPGYYHFQPHQNFCPCCGQRVNHNQTGGSWQVRPMGEAVGGQQNAAGN